MLKGRKVGLVFKRFKPFFALGLLLSVFFLGGCSNYIVLDPKGPVAAQQKDLILYSIGFMALICVVVYALFAVVVIKYRNRKNDDDFEPDQHGSKKLETIWTVIPILIIIALAIPTVISNYDLEKPPKAVNAQQQKEPIVINATAVNWKWIFSYPEQGIETVNYINIPKDRTVLFKLTSADSMSSFWVPELGGQKYAMAGMETKLYLRADHTGTFSGRNSNFNGEGFTHQIFDVHSVTQSEFDKWAKDTKSKAPKLTKKQYDQLMVQGEAKKMTFSSTHLKWVDHATEADYAVKTRERLGEVPQNPHGSKAKDANKPESDSHGESHSH